MMRKVIYTWAAVSLAAALTIGIVCFAMWTHSLNARPKPSEFEASVAMAAWESSIPHRYESLKSPLAPGSVNLQEASGHYVEHCAACHGNNGKGETKFKGIMYPRPPNLLSEDTQEKSDGELYWIIKNGVRWSGMPAFGEPGDDDGHAWKIVAFMRHLPDLTPAEEHQMEQAGESAEHTDHIH